jgi:hypothetical protein
MAQQLREPAIEGPRSVRLVSVVSALVLSALALLHGIWAFSPWPVDNRARFAEVVVGVDERDLPSTVAMLGVAGLLALAARLMLMRADFVAPIGPAWAPRWGVRVLAAALLLRGAAGLVVSGFGWGDSPESFRRLDLAVYSPLCLGLAASAAFLSTQESSRS